MITGNYLNKIMEEMSEENDIPDLKEIIAFVDEEKMSNVEGYDLVKDISLFKVRKIEGYYRPKDYPIPSTVDKSIHSLTEQDIEDFITEFENHVEEINNLNDDYITTLGNFSLDIWICILKRELNWREMTGNIELEI